MTAPAPAPLAPPVTWSWSRFGYGVVLALPAVVVSALDPQLGLGVAVGMLPAAAAGLTPTRASRRNSFTLSVVAAVGIGAGAVLGQQALLAVPGLFVLGVLVPVLSARRPASRLALGLAYPLVGLGLSFGPESVLPVAGVMAASGLYAWLVSLLWPEHEPPAHRLPVAAPGSPLGYGLLLGLAGALAATIGFGFGLDHKGWLCGATLLVMRPDGHDLVSRSLGRAASVLIGAFAGSLFVLQQPSPWAIGAALVVALALLAAVQGSRWYVAPVFTTFVVFLLLLWNHPTDTGWRFAERNLETLGGVTIALLLGLVVPMILRRTARTPGLEPPADR